jgi:hypothetical protein
VSQVGRTQQSRTAADEDLGPDDRTWLIERMREYRALLRYLHDH